MRGRIPLYENLIEGYMLKRIMGAYDNLLGESVRLAAVQSLTGVNTRMLHDSYNFIERTFKKIANEIDRGHFSDAEIENFMKLQENLAQKVSVPGNLRHQHPQLGDPEKLRQILFDPVGHDERAWAQVIWNSTELEKLIKDEKLGKFARQAFRELNKIQRARRGDLDDLDLSFRLVRLIMASKRPDAVL